MKHRAPRFLLATLAIFISRSILSAQTPAPSSSRELHLTGSNTYPPLEGGTLDVSPTFTLAAGDILDATIHMNATGRTMLSMTLTPQKRAELTKLTTENLGRTIKFVVNGKLRYEPVIKQPITGNSVDIAVLSPEEAVEIAKALLKQQP